MPDIRAVVFDLDGTLYLGGQVLPGAVETVQTIAQHVPVWYLTNNTSRTPEQYQERLTALGFPAPEERILSPLLIAEQALRRNHYRNVWPFANAEVRAWLQKRLPELDWQPDLTGTELALLTYHDTFTYADLCALTWRLQRSDVTYWATHPDRVCPATPGPIPDTGAIMELLASATGRHPDRILGKPDPALLQLVCAAQQCLPGQILFVGDRLYTDYALARRAECHFALTLTGETKREDLTGQPHAPQTVIEHLSELLDHYEFR